MPNGEKLNKMDLLNLLEIFCQWEMVAMIAERKLPQEAINLKLKLEQNILD